MFDSFVFDLTGGFQKVLEFKFPVLPSIVHSKEIRDQKSHFHLLCREEHLKDRIAADCK